MTGGCSNAKDWAELLTYASEGDAGLGARIWFWLKHQFQPGVKFDLNCAWIRFKSVNETFLVEVALICENRGFVGRRLSRLSLSIHGLWPRGLLADDLPSTHPFGRPLVELTKLVPPRERSYFIRPGVPKIIRHQVVLKDPGPLIRVTAGFNCGKLLKWRHTACRVFALVADQAGAATTQANTAALVPLTGSR